MLHVDIPTPTEIRALAALRFEPAVSLFLPVTPETQHIGTARIELGNLLKQAEAQLEANGTPKRSIWPISEQVRDLMDDDEFWAHQANGLAIFVTPEAMRTYRLPTSLTAMVQVSDRLHLKPILRVMTFGQHAFILALAENEVRLIEMFADMPAEEVRVPDLPRDAASAAGKASVNSRNYSGRIGGGEGQGVLLRSYCRKVDAALRPVLAGRDEPLILAATEPLLSMYRAIGSHDTLADEAIVSSPVRTTPGDLARAARPILDALHQARLAEVRGLFAARAGEGRSTTQIDLAARAATTGAVDTLLVDIDEVVPGTVDDATGAVSFAEDATAQTYGVVDEIARRTLMAGGTVLAVRRDDIPDGKGLAAILRYAV
jgi:hypothetical protein